jgi:tight adherence protein C
MGIAGVVVCVLLYFLPELRLYSLGIERREKITLELADTLDQMSIAVEAGLGFDAAMVRVAKNGHGVLAAELIRTLQDIQVGQTRRQAYEDLVERTQVPDLKQFIRSIIQAEAYGLALSSVLNTQAAEMRMKRRMRAEQKAMQIPVKVIFPLMLCILPVLFMVVMGPGVIGIISAFK